MRGTEPIRMVVRDERPQDAATIAKIVTAAFANAAHASGTEAAIIDALRRDGALTVSLVAEEDGAILGHVAFSPVTIDGQDISWFGLGPVAIRPDRQRDGTGQLLVHAGLDRLRAMRAKGCVVLGDPSYYVRFGFRPDPQLRLAGVPPEYFQRLVLSGKAPDGEVRYHRAFDEG